MIAIIGAGPAGLSCAITLQKLGIDARVWEKESRPGGLMRTEKIGPFQFDYAGHLLHFRDPKIEKWLQEFAPPEELLRIKRRSFIYSNNVLTPYPFQVHTRGLPRKVVLECLLGFLKTKIIPAKTPANFKQWVLANLGPGFAKHFLFPFNRKFWKTPLEQLDSEWAEWSVPRPSAKDVILGALGWNKADFGYNAWFSYPKSGGMEKIAGLLASRVENISLNREILSVHLKDMKILLANGEEMGYDGLVSTMPLKELIKRLQGAPGSINELGSGLRHLGVLCVNLGVIGPQITPAHWIYYPEDRFVFYRAGFYSNFSDAPSEFQSVVLEITYLPGKSEAELKSLADKAVDQFKQSGLLGREHTIEYAGVINIPCAYAVYDEARKKSLPAILKFLEQNAIHSIGRYGSWEYSSIEDALREGKEAAEKIAG